MFQRPTCDYCRSTNNPVLNALGAQLCRQCHRAAQWAGIYSANRRFSHFHLPLPKNTNVYYLKSNHHYREYTYWAQSPSEHRLFLYQGPKRPTTETLKSFSELLTKIHTTHV